MENRLTIIALIVLLCIGCTGQQDNMRPEIDVNYEHINMCRKEIGSTSTWQNFLIKNIGDANLIIADIKLQSDNNAFECFREPINVNEADLDQSIPCSIGSQPGMTILPNHMTILRIDYTPTEASIPDDVVDQATLVIVSNATSDEDEAELTSLEIAMCGTGFVPPEEPVEAGNANSLTQDAGTDAGVDDAGSLRDAVDDADAGLFDCVEWWKEDKCGPLNIP